MLLIEVLDFLETQGLVGGATGWARGAGFLLETPDRVIAVFETGGPEPELEKDGSTAQEYDEPTFQVRGRGVPFGLEELRTKLGAVYQALHGGDLGANYVLVQAQQSSPFQLALDEQNRPGLTWNFRAMRERS